MAAHLAHVLWATGSWADAEVLARQALADGRGGITTRITALHVLGYLALGRGDLDAATERLDEARVLGERMAELQVLSPALWGLAEVARLRGTTGTRRRYPLLMGDQVRNRRSGHTRVSAKNQVTLPVDAIRGAGIRVGDRLRAEVRGPGEVLLVREVDPIDRFAGALTGAFERAELDELRDEWD